MSDLLASFLVQGRSMVFVQLTALSALLLIAILIWGQLDQRTLDGVPVWVKPAKFAVSFLVHFAGAQKRTSNFVYLRLITDTYFKI